MQRLVPLLLAFCLTLAACAAGGPRPAGPASAGTDTSAAALVRAAATTLKDMRATSPHSELDHWLSEARAVVILPGVYRAGFLYSLHGGNGVVVARRQDENWSAPAFLSLGGAGFGLQAGLERARVVMVLLEREALEHILAGGPDFATTALYDVVGVRQQMGPDSRTRDKGVIAFSDGVGIMAGAALHLGGLGQNRGLNAAYHGAPLAEGEAVLRSGGAPGLEVFELWEALLPTKP